MSIMRAEYHIKHNLPRIRKIEKLKNTFEITHKNIEYIIKCPKNATLKDAL